MKWNIISICFSLCVADLDSQTVNLAELQKTLANGVSIFSSSLFCHKANRYSVICILCACLEFQRLPFVKVSDEIIDVIRCGIFKQLIQH